MNANSEPTDNAPRWAEDDTAHLPTSTMIDEVLRLPEASAQEDTVSDHLAVDDLPHMMNTMTEPMQDGLLLHETMVHHHQDDTMIHMIQEVPHLLQEAMTHMLVEIRMPDHAAHLLQEATAATAAVVAAAVAAVVVVAATEGTTIGGHIRYVCFSMHE